MFGLLSGGGGTLPAEVTALNNGMEQLLDIVNKMLQVITGNSILCILLAVPFVGAGIYVFRKLKYAVK